MAVRFIDFDSRHLQELELAPGAGDMFYDALKDPQYCQALTEPGLAFSAIAGTGRVLGCAGIIRMLHRGSCWMLPAADLAPAAWTAVARKSYYTVTEAHARGMHRLEAHVRTDFYPGMRLMELLGFKSEGIAVSFGPDKSDHISYARIA